MQRQAQLAVCAYAESLEDAADLLAMLGLLGESDPASSGHRLTWGTSRCRECSRPTERRAGPNAVRYGGRGMCQACYARWRRSQPRLTEPTPGVCRRCGATTANRSLTCTGCRVMIPSWPVQDYLQQLIDSGKAVHAIAREAELPHSTVRGVIGGWARVTTYAADQVLAVQPLRRAFEAVS